MASIEAKVKKLLEEIRRVCGRTCRNPEEITVLAASKYATADQINEAIQAGVGVIGENRIQDARKKFPRLLPARKHFIGHLQTNKVKEAVALFDCIESVDSFKVAEQINIEAERALKVMPVLVEVNVSCDTKKYGVSSDEVHHFLHKLALLRHVEVNGLMAIVPFFDDPADARPFFGRMRELFDENRTGRPGFNTLSMGMSQDFRAAIEEGATELRIGSYLFQ